MAASHPTASRGPRFPIPRLQEYAARLLEAVGVPPDDAAICAHVLVDADATGRDTHGLSRLPLYVERVQRGAIKAVPELRWEAPFHPAVTRLDGDNGLGPVVAWRATDRAVALAQEYGTGVVAVRRSNHCGAMSVYCEHAAQRGVILLALTNSPPGIPPWGGRRAYLGTNPIAWGFPRGESAPPLIIDLATSVVARGNIIQAARLQQTIPEGWAIDAEGRPTTDPEAALKGAVLPMAGPKGYALALAVECLTGVLADAGVGPGVHNPYTDFTHPSNVGHLFWALNPAALGSLEGFGERLAAMEADIRAVPAMPGGAVRLPGDRGISLRERYRREGVPIDDGLVALLNDWGRRLGVGPLA